MPWELSWCSSHTSCSKAQHGLGTCCVGWLNARTTANHLKLSMLSMLGSRCLPTPRTCCCCHRWNPCTTVSCWQLQHLQYEHQLPGSKVLQSEKCSLQVHATCWQQAVCIWVCWRCTCPPSTTALLVPAAVGHVGHELTGRLHTVEHCLPYSSLDAVLVHGAGCCKRCKVGQQRTLARLMGRHCTTAGLRGGSTAHCALWQLAGAAAIIIKQTRRCHNGSACTSRPLLCVGSRPSCLLGV